MIKNRFQKKYHRTNKSNPDYVLHRLLRTFLNKAITRKTLPSSRFCNFSKEEFRIRIESKFKTGMNWENWGTWHIDHIRPLSSFKMSKEDGTENLDEILKANSLDNLQPLWASENLKKHARIA
jgi:hypothetical protein